ncbi:TrlF family AAA-like ATPase [Gaiella occulta]|nr:hypothetical protein [Gaiella occulta]
MNDDGGAHFFRCDLQVHSPRDAQWSGKRPVTDDDRRAFATKLVSACRGHGLGAIAITDHHDLLFAPIVRAAAAAETDDIGQPLPEDRRLVVFPGIELTLAVPCQALLILDANLPDDRLSLVLEALAIDPHPSSEASLPEVVPLDHINSLKGLYEVLDQREWLRGRYIVLPNVTDGGHKSLMRPAMQAKYKEMPCVGGYLDGSIDKVGSGNAKKFAGEDPKWGNKPLSVFQTSDSRNGSFVDLGKVATWVKWSEPTAEALRQACLARDSRISQLPPQLPSVFISRLVVTNSKFLGPVDLWLNRQYNAVIGGRGTGKSTILDYIRWALCDQPASVEDDEVANPSVRQRRLIEATLVPQDAHIDVYFTINEIPHVVRRYAKTGEVLLKVGDGEFTKTRESDIRSLLPIHAYSQKQLSSVSVRVDELLRFVTAPIRQELDTLDRRNGEVAGKLRENYASLQRARDLDAGLMRSVLAEQSLAEQAANLRASLTGLSDDDRDLLNNKPAVDRIRAAASAWELDTNQLLDSGTALVAEIGDALQGMQGLDEGPEVLVKASEELRSRTVRIVSDLGVAVEAALRLASDAVTETGELAKHRRAVEEQLSAFDASYEEVKSKSTAHEVRLKELGQIEAQRKSTHELVEEQRRARKTLGDPQAIYTKLRAELVGLYSDRSSLLTGQCDALTQLSDGLLCATMQKGTGISEVEGKFRAATSGSGVRGARIESLFSALGDETDPVATWETALAELETLVLMGEDGELTSEVTPTLTRLGLPLADQDKVRRKITPDGWLDIALTPIADEPVFEYQTKEAEYIPFSSASPGQQATALVRILLAQGGMPLLIDQPEEDLDSEVFDVVERIWQAKRGRQLIFASHNANLVVNGDAELVIACSYRTAGDQSAGKIKLEGAIDVPAMRKEITHVIEGGEKAFRLRKDKYGF